MQKDESKNGILTRSYLADQQLVAELLARLHDAHHRGINLVLPVLNHLRGEGRWGGVGSV